MSRLRRTLGAVAAAAALALAPATAASAADGTIAHVEGTDEGLQILVSVPPDADIDLDEVKVTVDGEAADAGAALADTDTRIRRTTVLAIDTSESMAGARFDAAQAAALAFVDSVPDDVFVGIVNFDAEVTVALAPTTDRDQARTVIDSLSLNRDTMLYDGVLSALDLAGTEGQRSVLVLSDGVDTSDTKIRSVAEAIETSEALVDVVALEQDADQIGPLQRMADASGGQVISADSEALARAFSAEAAVLSSQVLVTAEIPDTVTSSQATVEVTLPSSVGDITASAYSTIQAQSDAGSGVALPQPPEKGWSAPDWLIYAGVGRPRPGPAPRPADAGAGQADAAERRRAHRHLQQAGDGHHDHFGQGRRGRCWTTARQAAAGLLERNRGLDARITHRLEGAGSDLKSSEWLLLHAAVFIGSGALGVLVGKGSLGVGLVFLALGAVGPWVYLAIRRSAPQQGVPRQPPRHPPADLRFAGRRSLARAVDGHRGPRGHRAGGVGVQAGADRDPAGRPARGRSGRSGRAVREQGLRVGGDGDQDPARGRRQPGRAAWTPSPRRCGSASTCAARSTRSPRRASSRRS